MKDFRELQVWQKAHALTLKVYRAAKTFPHEERYELASQIRRSAASVAAIWPRDAAEALMQTWHGSRISP